MNTVPMPQIRTYPLVWAKASAGACIKAASPSLKGTTRAVTTTAKTAKMAMPVPTPCPAFSRFPEPMQSPTKTVTPMVRLVMIMVIIFKSWLPEATLDCS